MFGGSNFPKMFKKDSPMARNAIDAPWLHMNNSKDKNSNNGNDQISGNIYTKNQKKMKWIPPRLTGIAKLRFKGMNNVNDLNNIELINEYPTCNKQFKIYCQYTTLHGFRYATEESRHIVERVIWIFWCCFGVIAAIYMMTKIWTRWEENPVITSVSSTNYPVSGIIFPSATICTINKAVTEKLIIQGCRYNYTLSQIRTIISSLVDPEQRNNDNSNEVKNVDGKLALKYLRLVAPKCDDYLISCRWNSIDVRCPNAFRQTLSDTGYCCTFNYIVGNFQRKDEEYDDEVKEQEKEFEWLQQAVWDYTDKYREKNSIPTDGGVANMTIDQFACTRVFDDDLFPGICRHLSKCRVDPKACNLKKEEQSEEVKKKKKLSDDFPLKAVGAGRSRGLTILTDTLRCGSVPTGSFKGLRVYVHHPEEFPNVGERGFVIGPGQENNIGISAVDIYSVDDIDSFTPDRRGCFFTKEFPLQYYKEYTRSSCVIECENEFIYRECECVPFYSPGNYTICSVDKYLNCVKRAVDIIQKRAITSTLPESALNNLFNFKSREEREQDKSCTEICLPSCTETFYSSINTAAPFPNQPEPNATKILKEAITEQRSFLSDINYITGSISVMNFYMRESSIMRYKRDELFTWEDFVSNLGGIMGLTLGFSLLSVVEIIYFFTLRLFIDRRGYRKDHNFVEQMFNKK